MIEQAIVAAELQLLDILLLLLSLLIHLLELYTLLNDIYYLRLPSVS